MTPENLKICFVLVPGLSPDNVPMLGLAQLLQKEGYATVATNFFGDTPIKDFADLTLEDTMAGISRVIDDTASKYDKVIGIGVSLGGSLLLEHAKKKENLYSIISVGTPFRLKGRSLMRIGEFLLPIAYPIWKIFDKNKKLRLLPIGAAPRMIRYMQGEFLKNLENIKTPTLFIHSKLDKITDYKAMIEFSSKLNSLHKEIVLSENGNHVLDYDPEIILKNTKDFLQKIQNLK